MPLFPASHLASSSDEHRLSALLAALLQEDELATQRFALLFARDRGMTKIADGAWDYLDRVDKADAFRTQYQIPLPSGTNTRRPDLSIAGWRAGKPAFQLIVEVKLDALFSTEQVDGRTVLQPAAYASAWEAMPPGTEAPYRMVGTLTRDPMSAGHRRWVSEVSELCNHVLPSRASVLWLDVEIVLDDITERGDGVVSAMARRLASEVALHAYPVRSRTGGLAAAAIQPLMRALNIRLHTARKAERRAHLNWAAPERQRFRSSEDDESLRRFLDQLPRRNQAAFRLALGVGTAVYTLDEIADKLGVSTTTVRRLLMQTLEETEKWMAAEPN